jgi:hypothetical protein
MSNWLFERHACTIGRIEVSSKALENKDEINAMVELYDEMTAFTWPGEIKNAVSRLDCI